jgi:adenylosuccinate synthase
LRAYIIVDLGFGDAGKGLLTDFLARRCNAGLVVRYNGGAQAGHNVVTANGRQHTFAQFGSATFTPGVRTYLSRHVVIHPGALLVEGDILVRHGVRDAFSRLRISDRALVITPFHQAANHIRELARGRRRHGSCGVGVGEAVEDALQTPAESVRAGDLMNLTVLRRKLRAIRERKREQLLGAYGRHVFSGALAHEWQFFEHGGVDEAWIASISRMGELGLVTSDDVLRSWLHQTETTLFEGAQGILLDADAGFHPYTTWSRCSAANARHILHEMAPQAQLLQVGVMRSYAVRHGPGPLPTETPGLAGLIHEHNQRNEWQGHVRYGWFDAVLARYALASVGKLDALALTHLDILPRLKAWQYCAGYAGLPAIPEIYDSGGPEPMRHLRLAPSLTLAQREKVTQALFSAAPVFEPCEASEAQVISKIEALVEQPVGIISRGPTAEDVEVMRSLPA